MRCRRRATAPAPAPLTATPRCAVAGARHQSRAKAGGIGRRYPGRARQQVECDAIGPSEAHLKCEEEGMVRCLVR